MPSENISIYEALTQCNTVILYKLFIKFIQYLYY